MLMMLSVALKVDHSSLRGPHFPVLVQQSGTCCCDSLQSRQRQIRFVEAMLCRDEVTITAVAYPRYLDRYHDLLLPLVATPVAVRTKRPLASQKVLISRTQQPAESCFGAGAGAAASQCCEPVDHSTRKP